MIQKISAIVLVLTATLSVSNSAAAYTLFSPTPHDKLRPMAVDRPNVTNSPQTIDPGHLQIEAGLISYAYTGRTASGVPHSSNMEFGDIMLKLGLLNWLDIELYIQSFVRITGVDAAQTVHKGFGDVFLLTKINFCGNDSGKFALALMPALKIPTNQNGVGNKAYEGGGGVLANYKLTEKWSMGAEAQFNAAQRESGIGHDMQYTDSIEVNYDPNGPLEIFGEFYSVVETEIGVPWTANGDVGILYHLTPNLIFDADVGFGLNDAAETVNTTVGISTRF